MRIEEIARIAHEINRAYCESLGDDSQPPWESAPAWQRESAERGVQFHLDNPEADPRASHAAWCEHKLEEGWTHGPVKDPVKKEHPCLVSYGQLAQDQRAKDYLFRQVVHSLKGYLDPA